MKKAENFKDVVKIWVGPKLMIFLIDPRDVEIILSSNVYIDKSTEYRFFKPWLGDGLLISTGKFRIGKKKNFFIYHGLFEIIRNNNNMINNNNIIRFPL